MGSLYMDVTTSDHLRSDSFTRDSQHQGGFPLPSMAAVLRVDVEPSHFLTSSGQMPDLSRGGSVRLTGEQPNSDVLQPVPSRSSVARECSFIPVEGTRLLRLPSASTSNSSTTQDRNGGDTIYPTHRSVLASQGLVPQASQVVGGSALQAATTSGPTFSTGPRLNLSRSAGPVLGCLAPIRESFINERFSEEVALMAAQGRRPSTLNLYSRRLRLLITWPRECFWSGPRYEL